VAETFGERAVIFDSLRAGPRKIDVCGDAEQAILKRVPESAVHRERHNQRAHARRDAERCEQRD
jgi:hypothetical protein